MNLTKDQIERVVSIINSIGLHVNENLNLHLFTNSLCTLRGSFTGEEIILFQANIKNIKVYIIKENVCVEIEFSDVVLNNDGKNYFYNSVTCVSHELGDNHIAILNRVPIKSVLSIEDENVIRIN